MRTWQYFEIGLPYMLALFRNDATRLPALGLLDRLGTRLGPIQTRLLLLKPIVGIFEVSCCIIISGIAASAAAR